MDDTIHISPDLAAILRNVGVPVRVDGDRLVVPRRVGAAWAFLAELERAGLITGDTSAADLYCGWVANLLLHSAGVAELSAEAAAVISTWAVDRGGFAVDCPEELALLQLLLEVVPDAVPRSARELIA